MAWFAVVVVQVVIKYGVNGTPPSDICSDAALSVPNREEPAAPTRTE